MRRRFAALLVGTALLTTTLAVGQQAAMAEMSRKGRSAAVWYNIRFKTGNLGGAGTDADVYMIIKGSKGQTHSMQMDNRNDNFERNDTDTFSRYLDDLGTVNEICVRRNTAGLWDAWNLAYVTVNGRTSSFYRWIPAYTWVCKKAT
jgi:lipoxygenase homology domain-containing protein 1